MRNAGEPFSNIDDLTLIQLKRLRQEALSEAKQVDDAVLAKAHPDLPEKWRNFYQRSLELRIKNLDSGGNINAEILGSELHDRWVDWYRAHKGEIKIPR